MDKVICYRAIMIENYGIHWFRRDLRVAGNLALKYNWLKSKGKVVGLFCFDSKFLSRPDMSYNRFQFFLNTLIELKKELNNIGSDLLVLDVGPEDAFSDLFSKLNKNKLSLPSLVTWGRDYEPFAKKRDKKMSTFFEDKNIETYNHRDHLLIESKELTKNERTNDGYQVYTPFSKKWLNLYRTPEIKKRIKQQSKGLEYLSKIESGDYQKIFSLRWSDILRSKINFPDHLTNYSNENLKKVTVPIPESGSVQAYKTMKSFVGKIVNYQKDRDFPAIEGTSKLSMFLKNGSITVPQIIAYYNLPYYQKKNTSEDTFFSELIWREFYYHVLDRHPRVEKEEFLIKYKKIKWDNNKKHFEAWKEGVTGFPIVDAGMRELKTTGWMHNRVRMIVASFLTKDLLIDWKWGEKYFMEMLLDGDLAPNNGGWQWAASTGCDPQPYFRIFNPWLQSSRFDKAGDYIKKYIPELSDIESKKLHEPIIGHDKYPEPIVDHSIQRNLALEMYKEARA